MYAVAVIAVSAFGGVVGCKTPRNRFPEGTSTTRALSRGDTRLSVGFAV